MRVAKSCRIYGAGFTVRQKFGRPPNPIVTCSRVCSIQNRLNLIRDWQRRKRCREQGISRAEAAP